MNEIINLGNGQFVKVVMLKGERGSNIATITKTGTSGLIDTYTVTLSDGSTTTFQVSNGKSIVSIVKTGSYLLTDTYTITYNDGTTSTFTVENGGNSEELNVYHNTDSYLADIDTYEGNALLKTMYGMSEQDGTPTPSIPVDIDSAVANFKIDNVNLISFPYANSVNGAVSQGITYTYDDDGTIHLNGTATAEAYFTISYNLTSLKKFYNDYISGTVRIGLYASEISNDNTVRLGCYLYDKDNYLYWGSHQSSNNPMSINLNYNNYEYDHHIIYIRVVSGSVLNDFTLKPRLFFAYGSNSTEANNNMISMKNNSYVRGVNNTITTGLTLRAIEVTSSDDYNLVKDGKYYIADTLDWNEDSGYSITRRIGEWLLDGSEDEDFRVGGANVNYDCFIALDNLKDRDSNYVSQGKTNRFSKAVSRNGFYGSDKTNYNAFEITHSNTFNSACVGFRVNGVTTVAQLRTWLASNPVTLIEFLATPTSETVTSAQAQALLSLKTYDEATYIAQTEDVEGVMEIHYAKSETVAKALTGHNEGFKAQEFEWIYGVKNLIPYPYETTSGILNGITFTDNGDGTVNINGTATTSFTYNIFVRANGKFIVNKGEYLLTGCPKGGGNGKYRLYIGNTSIIPAISLNDDGEGVHVTVLNDNTPLEMAITCFEGQSYSNLLFKPMLRLATIQDDSFTEYAKTNHEITKEMVAKLVGETGYQTVDFIGYNPTTKKLGLKVNGADSVIPFNSGTNPTGTLTITGTLGCGVGYDGLHWEYSTVGITIRIVDGVPQTPVITGNSVSSSQWSTSTNNHYGQATFTISGVTWEAD